MVREPISSARPAGLAIVLGLAIAALAGSLAWLPSAAHASGCEDSWTNTAGGSWFEGSNWSTNAPPKAGEHACITEPGTYTVTVDQTSEGVSVTGLTIGGSSGSQTLSLASTCSSNAKLTSTTGIAVETTGALTMTKSGACDNDVRIAASITNSGVITSEATETSGHRFIEGNFANTGTLVIDADTAFDAASATLMNEGTIDLASGAELLANNKDTITNAAGTIASTGTGNVFVHEGTFTQGAGKSSGEPVYVDGGTAKLMGTGAGSIAIRGTSTLEGEELAKGQNLTIESTCTSGHANVTRAGPLLNNGTIALTNADVCGYQANLRLGESTLLNKGTIDMESPSGGARIIEGNLTNEKTLSIAAGASVMIEGTFTQTKTGTYIYGIASPSRSGYLTVWRSTIAGTLSLNVAKGFKGALGQGYQVLNVPGYTGTFAKVKSATITSKVEPGLYYSPEYLLEDVNLRVTQAKVGVTPVEGAPGASVKLSGTGFPANDAVKLSLLDAKKVKTTFTSATTAFNGDFASEVTIPPTAAAGTGTFTAQDTVTGVKAKVTFKVT
jgi:hypothetical protein